MSEKFEGYENYSVTKCGRIFSEKRRIFLKPWSGRGYNVVALSGKGFKKRVVVHKAVARAFIPNPENKPCVNHIDGNKTNNNVKNLEWCTYSENTKHAYSLGLLDRKGEAHNNTKLNNKKISMIRKFSLNKDFTPKELSEMFKVCQSTISNIKNYKTWTHLGEST